MSIRTRFVVLVASAVVGAILAAAPSVQAEQGPLPTLDHILWIMRQAKWHGAYEFQRVGFDDMINGGGSVSVKVYTTNLKNRKASKRAVYAIGPGIGLGTSRSFSSRSRRWFEDRGLRFVAKDLSTGEVKFDNSFPIYYKEPMAVRLTLDGSGNAMPLHEVVVQASAPGNQIPTEAVVFVRTSPGPVALFSVVMAIRSGSRGHIFLPAGTYEVRTRWLDQYSSDNPQIVTLGGGETAPPTLSFEHPNP